jgi:K(+)-stimulated pyrophosphate-energized sodium pump
VGDNVGDVAGMGADLYESYVGSILSAAALAVFAGLGQNGFTVPFILAVVGVIASIIGTFFVRTGEKTEQKELLKSMGCTYVQGYYYSKPLPAFMIEDILNDKETNYA